jgi:hypothetical protein
VLEVKVDSLSSDMVVKVLFDDLFFDSKLYVSAPIGTILLLISGIIKDFCGADITILIIKLSKSNFFNFFTHNNFWILFVLDLIENRSY